MVENHWAEQREQLPACPSFNRQSGILSAGCRNPVFDSRSVLADLRIVVVHHPVLILGLSGTALAADCPTIPVASAIPLKTRIPILSVDDAVVPNSLVTANRLSSIIASVIVCVGLFALPSQTVADDKVATKHFENHIRPVLIERCIKCHGESKQEGELRLDSREAILKGGESGPGIVPGKHDQSLLIDAINHQSLEMPPNEKLSDDQIRHFEKWIAKGAAWSTARHIRSRKSLTEADRKWWAFRPLRISTVPTNLSDWPLNSVDNFIHRKLTEQEIQPAPPATKLVLIRRIYFDILGLPPTPNEVEQFINDDSPGAWEHLIDRLLADKRYGEHWARFWLDVVRYAESDGWKQDAYRESIWKYRDYVVRSFNNDKPYPQFVTEQLAGDEINDDDPENLVAAGFLRLGIFEYNQRDARGLWNDVLEETTDVVGDAFLGMSIACARCHDHKFDPILQEDYFKLKAFFEPVIWRDDIPEADQETFEIFRENLNVWKEKTSEIRSEMDNLIRPYQETKLETTAAKFPLDIQAAFNKLDSEKNSWDQQMTYLITRQSREEGETPLKLMSKKDQAAYDSLNKKLAEFDVYKPKPLPTMMTVTDHSGAIAPTTIENEMDGTPVDPGFLTVLENQGATSISPESLSQSTGRRTALANWIGDPANPLTNRVIVNRIWQQHFGQGLVATPNDFGLKGAQPSHPELLDWLTSEYIRNDWSFKKLHKLILMSATWQQSSHYPDATQNEVLDPDDQLLWRFPIRRLTAEQIRDSMLFCGGELTTEIGGPSVEASVPRRSLYVRSFRNTPNDLLNAFDVANGLKSVAVRDATTTPIQSLLMMNGDFVMQRATQMAARLKNENLSADRTLRIATMLAWGRAPTMSETEMALKFFNVATDDSAQQIDDARLIDFCHVLLNSSEFLYLD